MINIKEKQDCCGCGACVQACPKQCIGMTADREGFFYPHVDDGICVDCGLCENVCPVINQNEPKEPLFVYAAKNNNEEIRLKSSSGGIFTLLAEQIISEGGVVFGARFNENWEVVHDFTETIEGLAPFRGSKYVQSTIGDNFIKVKKFLSDGRKVLFSGTPCQISGLKKYLRKEYDNLVTVEVVCHGVPSPMIWRDYLDYKRAKRVAGKNTVSSSIDDMPVITDISFRDKTNGWKKFGFKIIYAASKAAENSVSKSSDTIDYEITPLNEDLFMRGFLKNLYLRPACHHCAVRHGRSGADISVADYWGVQSIHPDMDDDKGTGLVLINTERGENIYRIISNQIGNKTSDYNKAIMYNPCIVRSVNIPNRRQQFWSVYQKSKIDGIQLICDLMEPSPLALFAKRVMGKIKKIIKL